MALLESVHWETVTTQMRQTLQFLGSQPFMARFYLAGGTALALRIGHRRSFDLDFFSANDEVNRTTRQAVLRGMDPLGLQVLEAVDGNLLLRLAELRIGFFGYGHPLLETVDRIEWPGCKLILHFCRINGDNSSRGIAGKVSRVKGQDVSDGMDIHGSDETGIMNLDTRDLKGNNQASPFWIKCWGIGQ